MRFVGPVSLQLLAYIGTFGAASGQQLTATVDVDELTTARRAGWETAVEMVAKLKALPQPRPEGIEQWLADFATRTQGLDSRKPPADWPKIDVDGLARRNPNFWRAVYEISPGDPGVTLLYAGILLGGGESINAQKVLEMQLLSPGLAPEIYQKLGRLHTAAGSVSNTIKSRMDEGVARHDRGDYSGAMAKYREALAVWPQSPLAHFELAFSMRFQQMIAAGERPGDPAAEARIKFSPEMRALLAQVRRYSPLLEAGYGTDEEEVKKQGEALVRKIHPAVNYLAQQPGVAERLPDFERALGVYTEGCQEVGAHDLALLARQSLVEHRGRLEAADATFIAGSLRKLAPGPETEATVERAAGKPERLVRIVPAVKPALLAFTFGTPHFIQEKDAEDTYTIVVPVRASKAEFFESPGLRSAYALFDKPVATAPTDLTTDAVTNAALSTDKYGRQEMVWSMRSVNQGISVEVRLPLDALKHKAAGAEGVVQFRMRGLPDKQLGFFAFNGTSQASNLLAFRRTDFTQGDGDAVFEAMVAQLPDGGEKK